MIADPLKNQNMPIETMKVRSTGLLPAFSITKLDELFANTSERLWVPKRQDRYDVIWITGGLGQHLIDTRRRSISKGMIYCIRPNQVQAFRSLENLEGYIISFGMDFVSLDAEKFGHRFQESLFKFGEDLPVVMSTSEIESSLFPIVKAIDKEYRGNSVLRNELLREFLKIFLIYFTRELLYTCNVSSKSNELMFRFISLVQRNYIKKKMVTDYASLLSVSPVYLNKIVKKASGFPASHHIQQCIIIEAKRQAIFTAMSMKQIAFYLGFEQYTYFSKFFKKAVGLNFSDYRREMDNERFI